MEFRSNVGKLIEILYLAVTIATKNVDSNCVWNSFIFMDAKYDELTLIANGGIAAIKITVRGLLLSDLGYSCFEEGSVLLKAKDFFNCPKSYPPARYIDIHYSGSLTMNEERYGDMEMPTPFMSIEFPDTSRKCTKQFTINRKIFLDGLRSVKFAMGEFETQRYFMCLSIEVSKQGVKFSGGSGARFAVKEYLGKKIPKVKKPTSILIPSKNINNLTTLLAKSKTDEIAIKQTKDKTPQIIIEYDNVCLAIDTSSLTSGSGEPIQYPPVDKIINAEYPHKISFEIEKWKDAMKGIAATNTKEFAHGRDVHYSLVRAHLDDGYFEISSKTNCCSIRTVPFINIIDIDTEADNNSTPWFCCNSLYLSEIASKSGKHKEATIGFEDCSKLEGIPGAKSGPVLVKYPETDKKGIKEQSYVFFATARIEDGIGIRNNVLAEESEE